MPRLYGRSGRAIPAAPALSGTRSTRRRLAVTAALAAVVPLALSGCGAEESAGAEGSSEAKGATRTVEDATGARVKVPEKPVKVVTLSEMDLDSALALGVKPVGLTAGRGQKGAPEYLADKAEGIPLVGAVTGPDVEKVARAKPDVILAGQVADKQVLRQLRAIAPTVVTFAKSNDFKDALNLTANALNRQERAEKVLGAYDEKVAEVKKGLGDRVGSTVSVARYSTKGTALMQQGVFVSDVLKDLGFARPGIQKERGEGHSTPISDEDIAKVDGDWLFIGTLSAQGEDAKLLKELQEKPAYKELDAVREGHVTEIDGSKWTSLGGPLAAGSVLDDIEKAMAG
ncbi:ABC transporter substrate-binding protein [Streptomyces daliensis]|uniref:Iron-siderophore ABC transporter substrate-binding protein n=1 Tax=Streptomyces daliensis TaxID=299421 RepID=A0A8T4J4B5_9ACTN|nr:iron-siderophore ABC transporter substrate-binding protein [Streptomyces daliensis]